MTTPANEVHKQITGLGEFKLRPLEDTDMAKIHDWVNRDYASYWGMQNTSLAEVADFYHKMAASEHANAYLGIYNRQPAFLLESYQPAGEPIGNYYEVQTGDHGMHVLVAPADKPIPDFTWHVFTTIMDFHFSYPEIRRMVVEPDIRNDKIHRLNRRAGFVYDRVVELPEKTAQLAFCIREQYRAALARESA